MPPKLSELVRKGIAHPPSGMDQLIQLEVYTGSSAYAMDADTSDLDCLGFWVPPIDAIFPHLKGLIPGFDSGFSEKTLQFSTYTQHHMVDPSACGGTGRQYDYTIHSIVKFFRLLMTANPTIIEALYVPSRCVLHVTPIGQLVIDNRHLFLCKELAQTSAAYARGQLHKLRTKEPTEESKRHAVVEKYGWDLKFGVHVVRLIDQAYDVLTMRDIDLERNAEKLKSIKRGEWSLGEVEAHFKRMEPMLIEAAEKSQLPWSVDREAVRKLLLDCLEQHFGTLSASRRSMAMAHISFTTTAVLLHGIYAALANK
jgi:predicted nucleotidyltransferase